MKLSTFFPFRYGILLKLFTVFLIVLIPIYIIVSLMSKSGVNIIREQILMLMEQKSDYFVSATDSELERIAKLQKDLSDDPDLQSLSIRPDTLRDYERAKAINDLQSKLHTLSESSRYIKEAFVIIPSIERRISSLSGMKDINQDEFDRFLTNKASASGLTSIDQRIFFVLGVPHITKINYLMVVELSISKLSVDLGSLNSTGNGTVFIWSNEMNKPSIIPAVGVTDEIMRFNLQSSEQEGTAFQMDDKNYLRFTKAFDFPDWSLVTVVEEDQILLPVHSFKGWLMVLSVISAVLFVIASFLLYRFIHKPLLKMMRAFKKVEIGQFDTNLAHTNKDEFYYLFQQFNRMTSQLKILIQQIYEQKIHSQRSELKHLQSQVNPHFMYNSLYTVAVMAKEEDYEGVTSMSRHLGDYFKFVTQNKADLIPLEKEVQHAKVYSSIQEVRFGSRIRFEFQETGEIAMWEVPRLIIQPFLENAIMHGLEDVRQGGRLCVRVNASQMSLIIEIEDNGKGMPPDKLKKWQEASIIPHEWEDHALWNVHRRLRLRYGDRSGIKLQTNVDGGLTVALLIYLEAGEKDE
ncbi:sensor histidine kinase [Paenibacillus eucommiae]|uniref:Two-component system sensor histidine kinase YesM n=1 Tax=Paenibacillus eucommiae TaxID=1355755 RepID=A0ABS4J0X4_9BACL|nr:histidine kinase [Paenibacillus eucommiae]MBP1992980.1 two-component system sensor histidine kinase YesM [Paenibacillus eucommiae]